MTEYVMEDVRFLEIVEFALRPDERARREAPAGQEVEEGPGGDESGDRHDPPAGECRKPPAQFAEFRNARARQLELGHGVQELLAGPPGEHLRLPGVQAVPSVVLFRGVRIPVLIDRLIGSARCVLVAVPGHGWRGIAARLGHSVTLHPPIWRIIRKNLRRRTWDHFRMTRRRPRSRMQTRWARMVSNSSSSPIPIPRCLTRCSAEWASSGSRSIARKMSPSTARATSISSSMPSQDSFAQRFAEKHGPSAPAMAFRVVDAQPRLRARAVARRETRQDPGPARWSSTFPAIEGIGGLQIYLVDRYGAKGSIYDVDFEWIGERDVKPEGAGLHYVDHLTHNVHRGHMDAWAGFYEKLFNFRESASSTSKASSPDSFRAP